MDDNQQEKYHWLYDNINGLKEKIIYRDRIEYKISGKFHNSTGPAVIRYFDPLLSKHPNEEDKEEYYINGDRIPQNEWLVYNRKHKIEKLLK